MAAQINEEDKNPKKMKVFVAIPGSPYCLRPRRDPVALEVSRDDTVASVEVTLHGMEGIPPGRQRLVFARSAIPDDDDTTLGDHGVVDLSTIQLVETNMEVFVRCMHDGKNRTVALYGVETSDTVESFRIRLQQEPGNTSLRPALQRIVFGCGQLEDGHTLADYGVRNFTTMTLFFRPYQRRERWLEMDIEVTDTVGRIKERVEEAEGVPVACQGVYYGGKELDDGRALADEDGRPIDWVKISVCRQQEKGDSTKTVDVSMVVEAKIAKRRVEVIGPGKKIKKREKIKKKKSLAEAATSLQSVRRRRFRVLVFGPELAPICRSSCDMDPFP